MSDQQQAATQSGDAAQQATQGTQQATQGAQSAQQPGPIPYERFKEVNDRLRQLEQQLSAREAEQGKFKELLEAREKDLAELRAAQLRSKVAAATGLPAELAERLRGATEAELAADAQALVKLLGAQAAAAKSGALGVPPAGGAGAGRIDTTTMSPADIRKAWADGKIRVS